MCLEQGKLVPFPQSTKTRKKSKQSLTLIDVYYKYRAPFFQSSTNKDPGLLWSNVECKECIVWSVCKEWFHKKCERVPNIYFRNQKNVGVLFVISILLHRFL